MGDLYDDDESEAEERAQGEDNSAEEDEEILQEARERMKECVDYWKDNHDLAQEDVEFRNGDQWPQEIKEARKKEERPCLTFNRMETFIDQVVGDQRQNKPSINVSPQDLNGMLVEPDKVPSIRSGSDGKTAQYTLAQIYEGLIRNIEYRSSAENAYDTSFDTAVGSGFGYFRILTDYCDGSFDQEIQIARILDQFSVYLDPAAEKTCREDAEYGFIYHFLSDKEFDRRYGEDSEGPDIWDGAASEYKGHWVEERGIRVTEYFRRVPIKEKLVLLSDGSIVNLGADKAKWEEQIAAMQEVDPNITVENERLAETYKVEWYKLNGVKILERGEVPTKWIPIIFVPGKELVIDGKTVYRSLIRHGKDAQRNYNYWRTTATETVALASKAPWVGGEKAFQGYEDEWEDANTRNFGYLPFNEETQHPPQRQTAAAMPTGAVEEAQAAEMDMKGTIGIHSAGLGQAESASESGRKVLALQREGDVGSFSFTDNHAKALQHAGRIIVDMIPKVYSNERVLRILNLDGTEDFVQVNKEGPDGKLYDLGAQKFDVAVKVGPSYTTQREKAADMLLEMTQHYPELWQIMGDLIAQNLDFPGADEMARRLRKMVPPDIMKKDDENENGIPDDQEPKPPTPEQQLQMKELEAKSKEADAKIATAQAKAIEAESKIKEVEAQLAQLPDQIEKVVTQTLAQLIQESGALNMTPPAPGPNGPGGPSAGPSG